MIRILRRIKALLMRQQSPRKMAKNPKSHSKLKSTLGEIEQSFKDNDGIAVSVHKQIDSLQGKIT